MEGTTDVEAKGKKYGESEVEGEDDDGELAVFFCCGFGRPDDGVCGAMKPTEKVEGPKKRLGLKGQENREACWDI